MVYKDIIVKTGYVNEQRVPMSFQTDKDAPVFTVECINPIIYHAAEGYTTFKCRLAETDEWVTITLEDNGDAERWSVEMMWDITKRSKKKEQPAPKQQFDLKDIGALTAIEMKIQQNNKELFWSIVYALLFGIMSVFTCFGFSLVDAGNKWLLFTFFKIVTVFGFGLFSFTAICLLVVKLLYRYQEKRLLKYGKSDKT